MRNSQFSWLRVVYQAGEMVEALLNPEDMKVSQHKEKQMYELACINGTLKTDDFCHICGDKGHKQYECPTRMNTFRAANVRCAICGDQSHPTRDCPNRTAAGPDGAANGENTKQALDSEYMRCVIPPDAPPPPPPRVNAPP